MYRDSIGPIYRASDMYFQQIAVKFSYEERKKFKQLMNYHRLQKDFSGQRNQAEIFKHTLLSYLQANKTELSQRNLIVQQMKDLLKQKKFLTQIREFPTQKQYRQLQNGIKALRQFIKQKQTDSDGYNLYVTYLSQLRDLKQQNFAQFEANLNKYSSLNYQEKQTIRFLAKKIMRCNQAQQSIKSHQEVSQFLTEVLRYGFGRQILSLSAIHDKALQMKCQALVENINNNYIEIQPRLKYGDDNINAFLEKLSSRRYTRQEVGKILQRLPQKLQNMLQPLFNQVYTLREGAGQTIKPYQYIRGGFYDPQIKKAEEESLKQLVAEFGQAKNKIDKLQAELNKTKWFISTVSGLSLKNKDQRKVHSQIGEYIQHCENQQMRFNLLKIYQKFNNYGYKQPVHKTFKENRENELLTERLSKKISNLQEEILKYKEQTKELQQQKAESLTQRIQFLQDIERCKEIIQEKNQEITRLQIVIKTLENVQQEKSELQNLIKVLQQRSEQKSLNLTNEVRKNEELNQTLKVCSREKEQLQEKKRAITQQLQLKCQQLQEKNRQEVKYSRQDKIFNQKEFMFNLQKQRLQSQITQLHSQIAELRQSNQNLNSRNDDLADLQSEVQKLTIQNDLLTDKLQQFIQAKSTISEKAIHFDQQKQTLLSQIAALKSRIQLLAQNQMQTKERQQYCNRQIQNLKDQFRQFIVKYNQLLKYHQLTQAELAQYKRQNQNLMNEAKRMAQVISQKSSISKPSEQSRQNYTILQKELQQSRKLNELIKTEYMNFKEQTKNAFKTKFEEEISSIKANQQKLKENYKKLYDHFLSLKEKTSVLKKQNEAFQQQKMKQTAQQFSSLKYMTQRSQLQQKYKDIAQRYQSLKTLTEREMVKKQEQIANLKLELIRTERMSQGHNNLHEQQIKNEKLEYLESTIAQLQEQNRRLKMQVQRKEQEILILKLQQLK